MAGTAIHAIGHVTGDGAVTQMTFLLDKVAGTGFVPVGQQFWSGRHSYDIDTKALGVKPGIYRLTVDARSARTGTPLGSSAVYFTVVDPTLAPCDMIDGGTYTNPVAVTTTIDLGCPGGPPFCIGLVYYISAGLTFDLVATPAYANSILRFSFASGQVSVMPEDVTILTGDGNGTGQPVAALIGSYSCSGETATFTASGTAVFEGSTGLATLLSGTLFPITITGTVTINPVNTLSVGPAVFQ